MAKQIIVTKDNYGIEIIASLVNQNKESVDVTGQIVEVVIVDDNDTIVDKVEAQHIDSSKGIVSITLQKEHTSTIGLYKTYWSALDENNNVTAQEDIYYYCKDKNGGASNDSYVQEEKFDNESIINKFKETDAEIEGIKQDLSNLHDVVDNDLADVHLEMENINSSLETIENSLNYINNGETIQEAINRVSINGGVLRLENKRYVITEPLTIDVSKLSIDGNGATLDFSQAPINCECIKLISTANTPYLNNGNFIKSLEIVGKGKEHNQIAIIFDSDLEARATSHLDFEKLNIHEFGNGINLKRYCYLLRFHSVDIYNCRVCVDMPPDGADAGENFSFYGCGIFNSDIALRCNNVNGSFHFTACSIDYVSYAFDLVSSAKATFINGHIEGGCKIKGSVNIIGSWLVYTDAENMFEGNETTKITIKDIPKNKYLVINKLSFHSTVETLNALIVLYPLALSARITLLVLA